MKLMLQHACSSGRVLLSLLTQLLSKVALIRCHNAGQSSILSVFSHHTGSLSKDATCNATLTFTCTVVRPVSREQL